MGIRGLEVMVREKTPESLKEASKLMIHKVMVEGTGKVLRDRRYFTSVALKKKKKREEALSRKRKFKKRNTFN